jgi:transposase-like protein
VLRGEPLDSLARELGVTAATLAHWREEFLAGGQTALKRRPADERDDEIRRLRAKVGEITMNNELFLERCHRLEANRP